MSRVTVARMVLVAVATFVLAGVEPTPGEAGGVSNGLAVAVSPDGKRLVAGSANTRTLYELDPASLAVKRRVHLGWRVQRMAFAPDGKTLLVECTQALHWIDPDTLKPVKTLTDGDGLCLAPAAGLLAVLVRKHPARIQLYDMAGAEKAAVEVDGRQSISGFGLSPDGKRLAILYARRRDEKEAQVAWKDIPEELKSKGGAPLAEYKQRHDGQTSRFVVVDVATGKPALDVRTWFGSSSGGHLVTFHGDSVYVVTYDNACARFDAKGEATFFALANSHNYAKAASADGSVFLSGGLRKGTRAVVEGMQPTPFELDKLPGFPEYFMGFTFAADGTGYGATTAHRVVRIGADGTPGTAVPVY